MPGFPKSARLLSPREYRAVLTNTELNLVSGPLRLRVKKNRMASARLGLVVPKRGNAHAHRRNRIKRLVREEFRKLHRELPAVDVIVQVFGAIDDARLKKTLRAQLRGLDQRLTDYDDNRS